MNPKLNTIMINDSWLFPLLEKAKALRFSHEPYSGDIEGIFMDEHQLLGVYGKVPPHKDPAFPEWSYCLILHAPKAFLISQGYQKLRLKAGMIVELNIHNEHELRQADDDRMIWYPVDCDMSIPMKEAADLAYEAFNTPGWPAGVVGH